MRSLYVLTIISIFIIPLSSLVLIKGVDLWFNQYLISVLILFLGCSFVLWKFNKTIAVFLFICTFSALIGNNGNSFLIQFNPRALAFIVQIYLSCLAAYKISFFSKKQRKGLLVSICVLVVIQGIMIVLQYFNLDPIFEHISGKGDDTVAFSGSRNQAGLFFAVTLPIIIGIIPILTPLSIFGLLASTTSSAFLGAMSGLMVCLVGLYNKTGLLISVLLIVAVTFIFYIKFENVSRTAFNERIELVKLSVKQVKEGKLIMKRNNVEKIVTAHPLFGYGLGNFKRYSPLTQHVFLTPGNSHHYGRAHNDYIEVLFEMGYLGFISIIACMINFFIKFFKANKTKLLWISFSGLFAFSISACGIFTLHTAMAGIIFVILLGVFEGEVRDGTERT